MEKLQEYGKVGIITHLAISWTFFAGTFLTINRTKNPQKIIKWLKLENKIPAKAGTFAVSAIIYKAVMPIRLAVSLMAIPVVIKLLDIQVGKQAEIAPEMANQTEKVVA